MPVFAASLQKHCCSRYYSFRSQRTHYTGQEETACCSYSMTLQKDDRPVLRVMQRSCTLWTPTYELHDRDGPYATVLVHSHCCASDLYEVYDHQDRLWMTVEKIQEICAPTYYVFRLVATSDGTTRRIATMTREHALFQDPYRLELDGEEEPLVVGVSSIILLTERRRRDSRQHAAASAAM